MIAYRLWSNKHDAWWRPMSAGYTNDLADAGIYTEQQAIDRVLASAQCGVLKQVTCMVAVAIGEPS